MCFSYVKYSTHLHFLGHFRPDQEIPRIEGVHWPVFVLELQELVCDLGVH